MAKRHIDPKVKDKAMAMLEAGTAARKIAQALEVSTGAIQSWKRKAGLTTPRKARGRPKSTKAARRTAQPVVATTSYKVWVMAGIKNGWLTQLVSDLAQV